jgi:hypothetical protein
MSRIDELVDNRIVQNIVIWLLLMLIFTMLIQSDNRLLTSLSFIAFIMPPIYICNLKIVPLFFKGQHIWATVLFTANILLFTGIGVILISSFLTSFEWRMLYNVFGGVLLSVLFGSTLKITRDSFFRRQQEKEAELKLLKAQLNPHFLFNTLNNLYGLSVIKSDRLPSLMLKLSDLLRYSLYETKETFVPLEKEIQYLENYMSLEKIRLEDQTDISFSKKGNFQTQSIAPMLLIIFVENAFKHLGAASGNRSGVQVNLTIAEEALFFQCTNTIDEAASAAMNMEQGKSGIGLHNAKKRLALIYPDKHELKVRQENSSYNIQLKLTL